MTSVCLLTEGTYPYVTGGVSTWCASLVGHLPDLDWTVAHLADRPVPSRQAVLPPQVRLVQDLPVRRGWGPVPGRREAARLARLLPVADVYHATAVGTASAVAAVAAVDRRSTFVLTEHGTAWREVQLAGGPLETGRRAPRIGTLRRRWTRALQAEAGSAYRSADVVTAVSWTGAHWQRALGALDPLVLPHPAGGDAPAPWRPDAIPLVGLVARVVPLKDVATFVRACAAVGRVRPDCRFVVVGPLDADREYAAHCLDLVEQEGLTGRLHLVGEAEVRRWWPRLTVVVSTSRSEARPYVLLEAMQHGVPVVTTDVGDCAQMVADGSAAAAGLVVPPGDADAVACAVLHVLEQPTTARALSEAGLQRTHALGTEREHADAYRGLYAAALAASAA